jgi:hypothetical protein
MPENTVGQKAKYYPCTFIEPGLVSYRDIGIVLVRKPALDKMAPTFKGCPVFNEMHKEVTARDFSDNLKDGQCGEVKYNPDDGWYHMEFSVENEETIRNCEGGYSVSCAYDVTKWGPGGVYHNIPYAAEVLDGVYTHLAIVSNPRYEGARIIYNAQGGHMKLMFWKKQDEVKNASEVELENAAVAVGDEEVPISKMIQLWNSEEAKKKSEAAKAAKAAMLNDDDTLLVDGKRVTVGELKSFYLANADDDSDDEKEKKRKAKEAADKKENADDDSDEEKEKKRKAKEAADKKENADDDDKKKKDADEAEAKEKERKNAAHFEELRNAARTRPETFEAPKIMTPDQKVAEGYKRYGPITTTGGN